MEEEKKNTGRESGAEMDIVFSKSIKAGKRTYYLDVKKNRKGEMYLALNESKRVFTGEGDDLQVNYEKHKIFLYREDFEKFATALDEVIRYVVQAQGPCPVRHGLDDTSTDEHTGEGDSPIRLDIEF